MGGDEAELRKALETVLSKDALLQNTELQKKMDASLAVPADDLAEQPPIAALKGTADSVLAAARTSDKLAVDEGSRSVRVKPTRTTLLIRDVPDGVSQADVEGLLKGSSDFAEITGIRADKLESLGITTYFVSVKTEDATQRIALWLRGKKLGGADVRCAIKSEHLKDMINIPAPENDVDAQLQQQLHQGLQQQLARQYMAGGKQYVPEDSSKKPTRTTLLIRDVPDGIPEEDVKKLLDESPDKESVDSIRADYNPMMGITTYYVTLKAEDATQRVALWLKGKKLGETEVRCAIKTERNDLPQRPDDVEVQLQQQAAQQAYWQQLAMHQQMMYQQTMFGWAAADEAFRRQAGMKGASGKGMGGGYQGGPGGKGKGREKGAEKGFKGGEKGGPGGKGSKAKGKGKSPEQDGHPWHESPEVWPELGGAKSSTMRQDPKSAVWRPKPEPRSDKGVSQEEGAPALPRLGSAQRAYSAEYIRQVCKQMKEVPMPEGFRNAHEEQKKILRSEPYLEWELEKVQVKEGTTA